MVARAHFDSRADEPPPPSGFHTKLAVATPLGGVRHQTSRDGVMGLNLAGGGYRASMMKLRPEARYSTSAPTQEPTEVPVAPPAGPDEDLPAGAPTEEPDGTPVENPSGFVVERPRVFPLVEI